MTSKPRVRLITPIWGEFYIKRWLDLCVASLRADGNLSYLNEHCDFTFAVVTKAEDAARLSADPAFNAIMRGIRVEYVTLDEFLPATGHTSYGVPLTLAYAKAILHPGERALGGYVILLNADCIMAAGSMKSVVNRIAEGYAIIAATSIRTVDGTARARLYDHLDKSTGVLSIGPRDMMRLANEHLHSTVTGRVINDDSPIDSTYYHQIFWRISDDCLAMRGFLLQPLCFRVDRLMEKVLCPVDYGFLTEFCPNGRFCVLGDTDDYLMFELQERHSESHWLRVAPKFDTQEARLEKLSADIAAHAATWSTAEHRRSATQTIYYHSKDLPADLAARAAPFERFVDGMLASMPPAVSHIGHFQWLPAVRIYREDMARSSSHPRIALLDDPRNDSSKPAAPRTTGNPLRDGVYAALRKVYGLARHPRNPLLPLLRRIAPKLRGRFYPARVYRANVGDMVEALVAQAAAPVETAYVGGIHPHAPVAMPGSRVVNCGELTQLASDPGLREPRQAAGDAGTALVIYVSIGSLHQWDRMEDDVDALLAGREMIVLAFIREGFQPLPFEGHTYILSTFLNCLPRPKFRATLDVYVAPSRLAPRDRALLNPLHAAAVALWQLSMRRFDRLIRPKRPTGPGAEFSALVLSIRRRRD